MPWFLTIVEIFMKFGYIHQSYPGTATKISLFSSNWIKHTLLHRQKKMVSQFIKKMNNNTVPMKANKPTTTQN